MGLTIQTIRASDCVGKQAFDSPQIARKAAGRRKQRVAYRCRHCGFWHVGTTEKQKNRTPKREQP